MRKRLFFLLTIIFVSLVVLFTPERALSSGTFNCGWSSGKCEVASHNCVWNPPTDCQFPNYTQCVTTPDEFVCTSFVNQDCVDITGDPVSCAPGATPPPPPPDCIETAVGCIDITSPQGFIDSIFTLAIGVGGGIAFLLLIIGAFQVLTSAGNPDKVQAGKELITSAIAGLLLIIFAVFILQLVTKGILQIPGFT